MTDQECLTVVEAEAELANQKLLVAFQAYLAALEAVLPEEKA